MEDSCSDLNLSSLPKENFWGQRYLLQLGGFWQVPEFVQGVTRVIAHVKPLPADIILASFPKTGTTWLKALVYSIVNPSSKHRLAVEHVHSLVPFLEEVYQTPDAFGNYLSSASHLPRILSTHIPYQLLSRTAIPSACRVVYVTRNPKDTLVSMWHFYNKMKKPEEGLWPIEVAAEKFLSGVFPGGPYHDHVMGYKRLSLERPENVFFLTYEELKNDSATQVKRLAEFLGYPFQGEGVEGQIQEIVKGCSFEVLSNHAVNKSEEFFGQSPVPKNSWYRNGEVGDHKNYLCDEIIQKIDALTREKFHSSNFVYGI